MSLPALACVGGSAEYPLEESTMGACEKAKGINMMGFSEPYHTCTSLRSWPREAAVGMRELQGFALVAPRICTEVRLPCQSLEGFSDAWVHLREEMSIYYSINHGRSCRMIDPDSTELLGLCHFSL